MMQRYKLRDVTVPPCGQVPTVLDAEVEPDDDGDWLLLRDVEEYVADLEREVAELQRKLNISNPPESEWDDGASTAF